MKISHEYNGKTYDAEVMRIANTFLGYEDHGILTMNLALETPGIGCCVARNWGDVKGKMVLALYTDSHDKKCMGLASMYGDKTFIFDRS